MVGAYYYESRRSLEERHFATAPTVFSGETRIDNMALFGSIGFDITDRWAKKAGLVRIHRSQFQGERLEFVLNLIRSFAEEDGRRAGFDLAEMYRFPSNP